jgi:hypothetical protein
MAFWSAAQWLALLTVLSLGAREVLSGEPAAAVSFFLYDPSTFLMYTQCNMSQLSPLWTLWHQHGYSRKHSVDGLFLRDVMNPAWSGGRRVTDPSLADIFILPVLCSQARNGFCGWPDGFKDGVSDIVRSGHLTHLKMGVRDHLIVCDDYLACQSNRWPFEFIVGCFEATSLSNRIPVGYSTDGAALQLNRNSAFPQMDRALNYTRKYKLLFAGQRDKRPAYRYRKMLCDDIMNKSVPPEFVLCKWVPIWGPGGLAEDALVILSLPGDTATTDRFFNAFESLTIVAALSHDKSRLLDNLPFPFAIPWEDLIFWIDSAEFEKAPLQSVIDAVNGMSEAEAHGRLHLMRTFRKEATWTGRFSRASQNLLEAAVQARVSNTSLTDWTWI